MGSILGDFFDAEESTTLFRERRDEISCGRPPRLIWKGPKMITYDDFKKLDLRIGKVLSATRVEGADRLIRIEVDMGTERRQIIAGMAEFLDPDDLIGKLVPVLANLVPRKFRGIESRGMILAVDVDGRPILLHPAGEVPPGSIIR